MTQRRIAIASAILSVISPWMAYGGKEMKTARPVYFLKLSTSRCAYDVRVNDCPLVRDLDGLPVSATYPLNRWLEAGTNEFTISMLPVRDGAGVDPAAKFEAWLEIRDKDHPSSTPVTVGKFACDAAGAQQDEPRPGTGGDLSAATVTRTSKRVFCSVKFKADVPTANWRWQAGQTLHDSTQLKTELLAALRKAWNLFDKRDVEAVADWFRGRDEEQALSDYEDFISARSATTKLYQGYINDPELTLEDLWTEQLSISIFGHGKLVRLDDEYGNSPLYFANAGPTVLAVIPVIFYRDANGKLVPIR